jgi:hypothetical protein
MTRDPFQCRCVLCHEYGDRDEADRMGLTIIENVQQHGWHVVMVPEDEIGPGFAYTIDLAHTHGAPELALFGLDIHAMHRMLNRLGTRSSADAVLADGQSQADVVDGQQVALRQVDLRWYRTFRRPAPDQHRRELLKQDHFAEQFKSGSAVELPLDLLDAVHGTLDAARTPVQGEPGCHGVEVSVQAQCEAG